MVIRILISSKVFILLMRLLLLRLLVIVRRRHVGERIGTCESLLVVEIATELLGLLLSLASSWEENMVKWEALLRRHD